MKRVIIVLALAWLILLSYFAAQQVPARNQLSVGLLVFFIGLVVVLGVGFVLLGGGRRQVAKETVVIRTNISGGIDDFHYRGSYLYIPLVHEIEAIMPDYPLQHEFEVKAIDTQTPKLQQITKIKVRVSYWIRDARVCFDESANLLDRIKELEENNRLSRSDLRLWKQVLNELMAGIIDDAIRDGVWKWAETVVTNPNLRLSPPFSSPVPDPEYDPYALSLNRINLASQVASEVGVLADRWGLAVDSLAFENIEIDPKLIEIKTRNKPGELANATHDAQKEAIAIRIKGEAEAEVRAQTIAKVIDVLIQQKAITISDQILYNIVRAAMYSDGEMIWKGVVEKSANGNVKTA